MITFTIDTLTPCLTETSTGEIFETEVIQLKRKSFLSKFNKRTGWYVNWSKFEDDVEVYALVLKGSVDVQGLIALRYDECAKAVHIVWACTAPWNNKIESQSSRYQGVGGHLFAIAADLSFQHGYEGYLFGEASNVNVRIGNINLKPFMKTLINTAYKNEYINSSERNSLLKYYNLPL